MILCFSQITGKADFGYRIKNIDVELSQKFPPAIAFELLESEFSGPEGRVRYNIIPLSAGFPDLGPVLLDEVSFGFAEIESSSMKEPQAQSRSQVFNDEDVSFSEEEKLRLRMARQSRGLEIEDLLPRHEVSFSERVRAIINEQSGSATGDVAKDTEQKAEQRERVALSAPQDARLGTSIRGEIEFVRDGSLAMTDQHFIDVRRFEEGIPKEVAQVDLQTGTFTMNVQNTKGIIIGRLTNQKGGVEGEGLISVADLLSTKNPKIVLKKLASRQNVRAASAYGKSNEPGDKSVYLAGSPKGVRRSGSNYDINGFHPSSDLVAETESKNHIPTVSMINMLNGAELVMLPERMVSGLADILAEQDIQLDLARGDSLIWGTVQYKGRPVEGATIISQQGRSSYFGGLFMPDQTRQTTSENGMFVVAVDQPGWNDLYVELADGRGVHVNALVYPGKVTQVIAEIPEHTAPVTLRTFDAFTGEPVRAKVEIQQLNDFSDTGDAGANVVELPKTRQLSFVVTSPEWPYEKVRLGYTDFMDYLHIPLFTKTWLEGLRAEVKLNDVLQTGHVVGFVQGDDFSIEVPNNNDDVKIVYFDPQGRIAQRGALGGGFAIFNLSEEVPNIVVTSEREQRQVSRTVRPEYGIVQIVNVSFE
jgi:hypothetical protein